MAGWEQINTGLMSGLQTGLNLGMMQQKVEAIKLQEAQAKEAEKQNRIKNAFEGFKTYLPMLQSPSDVIRKTAMDGVISMARSAGMDLGWSQEAIDTIARAGWADDYMQPLKNISKLTQAFEKGDYGRGPQAEKTFMMGMNGELAKIYDHAQRKQIQEEAQAAMTRSREASGAEAGARTAARLPGSLPSPADIQSMALGGKEMAQAAGKAVQATLPSSPPVQIQILEALIQRGMTEDQALRGAGLKPTDLIPVEIGGQTYDLPATAALPFLRERSDLVPVKIAGVEYKVPAAVALSHLNPKEAINDFNVFYRSEFAKLQKEFPEKSKDELEGIISERWQKKLDERAATQGQARGEAFAATRGLQVYDTVTDAVMPKTWKEIREAGEKEPGRYIGVSDPNIVEKISQARMRGGATTANVVAASKMYHQEAPELIDLRNKVHKKGLLPKSQFKDLEAINQWLGARSSDPDVALLKKKTKFLADSLMRVMGGSQGGEWAFKVAADILDPTFGPEAFAAIVESHGIAMERMGRARQSFGKEETIAPTPSPSKPKFRIIGVK